MKKFFLSLAIGISTCVSIFSANSVTTVTQVTGSVNVSGNVDYTITSTEPFTTTGSVNIVNAEHAVVIISKIKPSKVIENWLKNHVYINGKQAVNGTNCDVRVYNRGAIIYPYDSDFKPLTVFSEQKYGGTAVSDFGLENTGGYMNTLSEEKLNNKIRSFKLKRGYMVTFSTRAKGRGYSRCFIADKEDLEFSTLPIVLDQKITSYRIFKWWNTHKAGLGSDGRAAANDALNSSWCYDWAQGNASLSPDVEWVPNHIYEDYPSSATCGSRTESCHMKTNNEPGNSADDHPQDVATVLANWENLMATGMRLCSESSHDGSMNHLKAFMDSIDARGWRCDILDLHCYWDSGTFNNLNWYSDHYGNGRPIWISEWVWGASWNHNGFWAKTSTPGECSDANQTICYNGTVPILNVLNSNNRVERYAYWNSEAAGTHIYHDGALTKLGRYYAEMDEGMGYNASIQKIPTNPRQSGPGNLTGDYNSETKTMKLSFRENNGEYNQLCNIEYKKPNTSNWEILEPVELKEAAANYNISLNAKSNYRYRIRVVDLNGKEYITNEVMAVDDNISFGDPVEVEEKTMYLGGNQLVNGSFDLGTYDWTTGRNGKLTAPYFQVVPVGGYNGTSYLQCYGNSTSEKTDQSVRKVITFNEGDYIYVTAAGCNNGSGFSSQKIAVSYTSSTFGMADNILTMKETTKWYKQTGTIRISEAPYLGIILYYLGGTAQFDDFMVAKLFDTPEAAIADALEWEKKRGEAFKEWNTEYPFLNTEMDNIIIKATDPNELESQIKRCISAVSILNTVGKIADDVTTAKAMVMPGCDDLSIAFDKFEEANTAEEVIQYYDELISIYNEVFSYTVNSSLITNPSFSSSSTGWNVKAGTYTGGDQSVKTLSGKTCWNAWWNVTAAGGSATTLAINQQIKASSVVSGFYALENKALTQHYCETDQHSFLTNVSQDNQKVSSPVLPYGVQDLPQIADAAKWLTLVTPYIYVNDGDNLTIGFESSKDGASDNTWVRYGSPTTTDMRQGWWCATGFQFRYIPAIKKEVNNSGWETVCFRYAFNIPEDVKVYNVAGILKNHQYICLEEVQGTRAGRPYVIMAPAGKEKTFFEYGRITSMEGAYQGLYGMFVESGKYPVKSLVLEDGVFKYIPDEASRIDKKNYSAYIDMGDLTELDEWAEMMIPTSGLEDPTAIKSVKSAQDSKINSPEIYDISGRRANADTKGIVIENGVKKAK